MSESILVVDDSADNRELTQILLEFDGFEVRLAEDATQALSLLKSYRPSLILMDVQLPGADGFELTRRLKLDPATRDIIVLAITAYAMPGDQEKAYSAG